MTKFENLVSVAEYLSDSTLLPRGTTIETVDQLVEQLTELGSQERVSRVHDDDISIPDKFGALRLETADRSDDFSDSCDYVLEEARTIISLSHA